VKKNILIITTYFPPVESVATLRMESFAKYLDKDKFNIFVLTTDEFNEYKNPLYNVNIIRIKRHILKLRRIRNFGKFILPIRLIIKIYNRFIVGDENKKWMKRSLSKIMEISKSVSFDIIISSYAPAEAHELAYYIKEKFPLTKWIADMRDEMSLNPYITQEKEQKYNSAVEKKVFERSDAITSVSEPIISNFKKLCHNPNVKFEEILNGYDMDVKYPKYEPKKFRIIYTGSFYGERKPDNFLKALSELVRKNLIPEIQIFFVGKIGVPNILVPEGLKDKCQLISKNLSYRNIHTFRQYCSLLLLIIPSIEKNAYFTKFFDYIATLRPILALVDKNGVAAKLINEINAGYIADVNNIEEIKKVILKAYDDWKKKKCLNFKIQELKQFHRKEQIKKMERIIELI